MVHTSTRQSFSPVKNNSDKEGNSVFLRTFHFRELRWPEATSRKFRVGDYRKPIHDWRNDRVDSNVVNQGRVCLFFDPIFTSKPQNR